VPARVREEGLIVREGGGCSGYAETQKTCSKLHGLASSCSFHASPPSVSVVLRIHICAAAPYSICACMLLLVVVVVVVLIAEVVV
jgi:hypothetical protein